MLAYLLFFFAAVGAKLILAVLTIFLLLPTDRRCTECDGETLLVRMGGFGRFVSRLMFGILQRRWCPRCGWEGTTRRTRGGLAPHSSTPGKMVGPLP